MMTGFVAVPVMASVEVLIQLGVESIIAAHQGNHARNVLHHAEEIGPRTPFSESGRSRIPGSPTLLVPGPVSLFRSHEAHCRVVQILIVPTSLHKHLVVVQLTHR